MLGCLKSPFRKVTDLMVDKDSFNTKTNKVHQEIAKLASEKKVNLISTTDEKLKLYTGQREHDSVVLKVNKKDFYHVKKPQLYFSSIHSHKSNLLIVLDQVIDPQNLGSVIRSAYLLGADSILINKNNKPPISPALAKVSAGVSEGVPIFTVKFVKLFLEEAIKNNYKVITTFMDPKKKYNTVELSKLKLDKGENIVLVFGSESSGITDVVRTTTTINLNIKQQCTDNLDRMLIDSLNVGVSAGIVISKVSKLIKSC